MDADDARLTADLAKAKEMIESVQAAVERVLSGADGEVFLEWLSLVSGANRTTFHPNTSVQCYREGRRSLFLEIIQFKTMSAEQIFRLRERQYLR